MTTTYPRPADPVSAITRPDGSTEAHSTDHGRVLGWAENIVHFGAVWDEPTAADNNRIAIQAALDTERPVYIPALGDFYVAPETSLDRFILTYHSKQRIFGEGPGSTIKVGTDAGDFGSIFGPDGVSETQDLIAFADMRFDFNPTGNTTCNLETGGEASAQNAIRAHNSSRLRVRDCWFDPCVGVNTITAAGTGTDVKVRDCHFVFVAGASTTNGGFYDNSAVYLECDRHSVIGCFFTADTTEGARGAVETHGGRSTVVGNVTNGFETLANIVSRDVGSLTSFSDVSNIVVANNSVRNASLGVEFWAGVDGLRNVTVQGNTIHLNQVTRESEGRAQEYYQGVGWQVGAILAGDNEGITIADNVIRFEQGTRSYDIENYTAGIAVLAAGDINGLNITNNTVIDAPTLAYIISAGIVGGLFENWYRGVHVSGNIAVDAGRDAATSIDAYRSAWIVANQIQGGDFSHNSIIDTGASSPNGFFAYTLSISADADMRWKNNQVSTASGDPLQTTVAGPVDVDDDPDTALQVVLPDAKGGLGTVGNLITYSEQFDNAAWTKDANGGAGPPTITPNATAPPHASGTTADEFVLADTTQFMKGAAAVSGALGGRTFTFSVFLKGKGTTIGKACNIRLMSSSDSDNTGGAYVTAVTLTAAWQRASHTYVFDPADVGTSADVIIALYGVAAESMYVWGAQVTETSSEAIYVTTAAAAVASFAGLSLTVDKALLGGGLGVGNSAAATVLGSVVKKMQVFDATGSSLGYLPIYDAIT